jgi:large subunit ribosomal protein L1
MRQRSKRYRQLVEKAGANIKEPQGVPTAVSLVKQMAKAKFTESIDLSVHLNLDTKKADQQFRGSFGLPHGTGKSVRVIAFTDDKDAAMAAGAIKAGGEDLVNEVLAGFMDFDVVVASPKMMRFVGKLGKALGPRGLMPSPKSGTVTDDVNGAVKEFKGGKIEYRSDAAGNVHVRVGNSTFEEKALAENISAFLTHVSEHRPSTVKGDFVKNVVISSTMGPGVRIAFVQEQE